MYYTPVMFFATKDFEVVPSLILLILCTRWMQLSVDSLSAFTLAALQAHLAEAEAQVRLCYLCLIHCHCTQNFFSSSDDQTTPFTMVI